MRHFFAAITVLFLFSSLTKATVDMKAPVTEKTIVGIWEAVSESDVRVFQLEIKKDGSGILADATEYHSFRSQCQKGQININKGRLVMLFSDADGNKISIQGIGYSTEESGVLDVVLDKNPNANPNLWNLKFYKFKNKTYVQILEEMSQRASMKRTQKAKVKAGL